VSECDLETSTVRMLRPTMAVDPRKNNGGMNLKTHLDDCVVRGTFSLATF
jgi:hypothetical protein